MDELNRISEINIVITKEDIRHFRIMHNIAKRKKELLLTDSMFSQQIGVSYEEYRRWTQWPCKELQDYLPSILKCLKVDLEYLLSEDE